MPPPRPRGDNSRTVYSSEHGRVCPHCGLAEKRCQCRANPRAVQAPLNADADGVVRVGRSSKGRGGKTVTLVTGVQLPSDEFRDLAKALKRQCGTGGTAKGDVIEIQGDQRDAIVEALEARGFQVKRTGG
jgi:translation initiation factor 1